MLINKDKLLAIVESSVDDPLDRVSLAAALVASDWLVDEFVARARRDGVPWSALASALEAVPAMKPSRDATSARPDGGESHLATQGPETVEHQGKYRALWQYLRELPVDETTMSFAEIEAVLGFRLPPSSRKHVPHWYGYEGSAVARAVVDAGWKARNADLVRERVSFARVPARW